MDFPRDVNQSEIQCTIVTQLKSARAPMREFKPPLYKSSKKPVHENETIAQINHIRKIFYLLKEKEFGEKSIFSYIYANINDVAKFRDENLFSLELIKLRELRLVSVCQLMQFKPIKGRFEFPAQDERVNCNKRPADLDESLLTPVLNFGNKEKVHLPYNLKLVTCKPDVEFSDDTYFRSLKSINKMEVLLKESPILSYNIPSCQCSTSTSYRCHHCQKVIKDFYPCHTCDICVFCDIECYLFAFDMYHRWECFALQRHMFSTNLMLTMRLMLIGTQMDFINEKMVPKSKWLKYHSNTSYARVMSCHRDYIQDKEKKSTEQARHFGIKIEAFNKYYKRVEQYCELKNLPVNWDRMKNNIHTIVLDVLRLLGYLAHSTDLFQQLKEYPWTSEKLNTFDLHMLIGGMLLRHYGEVLCNVIALPNVTMRPESLEELEDSCTFVIGTHLGRFQHSCEPNAVCFLYNNEVVVRACGDIEKNSKIFINYFGIEDPLSPEVRSDLMDNMYFKCVCKKCQDKDYEFILGMSAFKCPTCGGPLFGESDSLEFRCFTCDSRIDPKKFIAKEKQVKALLSKGTRITEFLRAEKICHEIYKSYHPNFDQIYRSLQKLFVINHDSLNTQIYFKKYIDLSTYGMLDMAKSLAKYHYFFLQHFLDMCQSEKFFDVDVMNILIRALSDVKLVYMFYYNIEQVSLVTDLISGIDPLLQHRIAQKKNANRSLTNVPKDGRTGNTVF